jgi:hypothetical protein
MQQSQYIKKLLSKFRMEDCKTACLPLSTSVKLMKEDNMSQKVDPKLYQSLVGGLLYIAIGTRPDIAVAVNTVAQFSSCPNTSHMTAAKQILKYLKGTMELALCYNDSYVENGLYGYSDANWAGDSDDRKSTSGHVFLFAGGAVSWFAKKQPVVALSTAEAEYTALSFAVQEAVWLRRLLKDLGIEQQNPTVIKEDNQGCIAMIKNPVSHTRTKHIDIKYHFNREAYQNGIVTLEFCPTDELVCLFHKV